MGLETCEVKSVVHTPLMHDVFVQGGRVLGVTTIAMQSLIDSSGIQQRALG